MEQRPDLIPINIKTLEKIESKELVDYPTRLLIYLYNEYIRSNLLGIIVSILVVSLLYYRYTMKIQMDTNKKGMKINK